MSDAGLLRAADSRGPFPLLRHRDLIAWVVLGLVAVVLALMTARPEPDAIDKSSTAAPAAPAFDAQQLIEQAALDGAGGLALLIAALAGGCGLILLVRSMRRPASLDRESSLLGFDLLTALLAWFDLQLAMLLILPLFDASDDSRAEFVFAAQAIVNVLMIAVIFGLHHSRRPHRLHALVGSHANAARNTVLALCSYACFLPILFAAATAIYIWLGEASPPPTQEVARMIGGLWREGGFASKALVVGFVVVVVPIFEELAFRGALQGYLHERVSGWLAIFVAAVIFTAIHVEQDGYSRLHVLVFMLALFLGTLYARTRQIQVTILVHALHNGLQLWLQIRE